MNAYLRGTQDKDRLTRLSSWLARASRTPNRFNLRQSPLKRIGQTLINVFEVFYEPSLVTVATFMVISGTWPFEMD